MNTGSLTVMFEDPFWIGLFEQTDHEGLHVCKVTFGAEPTDKEVMAFIDKNWHLLQFSQAVEAERDSGGFWDKDKSQATTTRSQEADAVAGHRYQVAAGPETSTGAEQDGAKTAFKSRTRSRKTTSVRPAPGQKERET